MDNCSCCGDPMCTDPFDTGMSLLHWLCSSCNRNRLIPKSNSRMPIDLKLGGV
jgi:hypothetical protein